MQTILLLVHMLAAIGLIGLVLLQQGKGADMGAAFGAGASATVFGSRGAASFMTRATAILATVFFVTSLSLAYFSGQHVSRKSVTEMPVGGEAAPAVPTDLPESPAAAGQPADAPQDVPKPE